MGTNYLTTGPITQNEMNHFFKKMGTRTDTGGHSLFLGQVRADETGGKKVIAIEYTAYEGLIIPEAEKIKDSILSEFYDVKSIDILHSIGVVKTGEISLMVLVSAGHRHHAVEACSRAVELIKERFPVWKKELFNDNSQRWK
jgi:molybdopterin synthase catalytic subunit